MAVTSLLKLAGFADDLRYVDIAHQALAQMQPMTRQYPVPKPPIVPLLGDRGFVHGRPQQRTPDATLSARRRR